MTEWKPIETAPKNGEIVLLAFKPMMQFQVLAFWDIPRQTWNMSRDGGEVIVNIPPTHWRECVTPEPRNTTIPMLEGETQ